MPSVLPDPGKAFPLTGMLQFHRTRLTAGRGFAFSLRPMSPKDNAFRKAKDLATPVDSLNRSPLKGAAASPAPPRSPGGKKPPPLPGASLGSSLLKPGELDSYSNLLLFADAVVQGFFSGRHRSVDYGSSAEFAEYKAWQPGDPVGHVDWRVYARSRRLVVRRHREEKQMSAALMVDVSASMGYKGGGRESKMGRAARIAAALASLMQRQGDKFSLTLFSTRPGTHRPPGGTRRHLMESLSLLERAAAWPEGRTDVAGSLELAGALLRKRGSLVVISDFLTDTDALFRALGQYRHRHFDILLLEVTDPDERLLPDLAAARFVDMETGESMEATPDEIRAAYRREMEIRTERMKSGCASRNIAWHQLRTEDPWRDALDAWLGLRGRAQTRKAR